MARARFMQSACGLHVPLHVPLQRREMRSLLTLIRRACVPDGGSLCISAHPFAPGPARGFVQALIGALESGTDGAVVGGSKATAKAKAQAKVEALEEERAEGKEGRRRQAAAPVVHPPVRVFVHDALRPLGVTVEAAEAAMEG